MGQRSLICQLLLGTALLASCRSDSVIRPAAQAVRWIAGSPVAEVNLLGVDLIDEKNGWAVGDIGLMSGAVVRTTDGGLTWQAASRTDEILAAITFVSPTQGWVAGYAGRIQRTEDGGFTWKVQRAEHTDEVLNSIFFLDADRGWAVGGAGLLLSTADAGATWHAMPLGRAEDLWAVRFVTPERGFIVGEDGLILATVDGGREWGAQSSGTNRALLGLAVGPDCAVAVGEKGTILRTEDFMTWGFVEAGTSETLNAIARSGDACWAVGSKGATVGSTDRGRSWKPSLTVVSRDLMSVSVASPFSAVAVGRRGAVQLLGPK
ncbi:MAG: YCF48-related protein [Blastocatellia bacterium]